MDIQGFIVAFFTTWVGWMSGLVSVILTFAGFRGHANHKKLYFIAACICFIIAPIHIWTVEHRARLRAEDVSKPKLKATILGNMVGTNKIGQTVLTIFALIVNRGAPSIATSEKLIVKLQDGRQIIAKMMMPPLSPVVHMGGAKGYPDVVLKSSDYLPNKALDQPIAQGSGKEGWMMFIVPEASRDELESDGAELLFQCRDIDGKPVDAPAVPIKRGFGRMYNPANPYDKQQ